MRSLGLSDWELFQLTLPVWGATGGSPEPPSNLMISTHAPRVGSDTNSTDSHYAIIISTHAPRVGSDCRCPVGNPQSWYFNSRSPCGERPVMPSRYWKRRHFNSRSPCGERRASITLNTISFIFQLTLPVWGATRGRRGVLCRRSISTHAPRVGSDLRRWRNHGRQPLDFNSRSPCGERPPSRPHGSCPRHFNSRSPCGERLTPTEDRDVSMKFQLTLPVWGATPPPNTMSRPTRDFNSRSPCGERRRFGVG